MKEKEVVMLVECICEVLADIENEATIESVRKRVEALCLEFPVYKN